MMQRSWKVALIGAAAALGAFARPAAADEGLALRRVLLSSGGVGYFEYEAKIQGDAEIPLRVRLDQVDDVLKSIVVYDEHGDLGEVTLPGKTAASEAFRDLPFDPDALGSEAALLTALRGAEVRVTTAEGDQEGRVIAVTPEVVQLPNNAGTIERHRLAIAAADGTVSTVILEEADRVKILDPALEKQIDAALQSLIGQKDRGRRTLTIRARGAGDRTVRVGYVVSVPLWKSTYRLTLPADPVAKSAKILGLAVVENQSGADYHDVDLTLVSGNPVTFRQALYQSYYVDRPEIPVEVVGRVLPRLDEGAVSINEKQHEALPNAPAPAFRAPVWAGAAGSAALAPPMMATEPEAPPSTAVEEATQVSFHLEHISIAAGEAALLPILDRSIPAERVSVYQPDVATKNPIASVMLQNDGETGLPPGVITVLERGASGGVTYLGDARLAVLPAGDHRLVSFGVDQKVRVDRRDADPQTVTVGTIAGGVLDLTRTDRRTTTYTIAGAAREARTVLLEHPRLQGFDLAAPRSGVEATPDRYRIRVEVPAGGTTVVTVTLQRPVAERVGIADLPRATLEVYASSADLPAPVRAALARVAALRATVDDKAAAAKQIEDQIAQITADQARVRDNLKVVPSGSALSQRYLDTLADQETKLAALRTQLDAARRAVDDAKKALADAIRTLRA